MADDVETTVAPSAVERAMAVYETFKGTRSRRTGPGPQGAHRARLRSGRRRRDRRAEAGRLGAGPSEIAGEDDGRKAHSESHIVELEDGSQWQIFPGDLDVTLNWKPETDLSDDEISSHMLLSAGAKVHVIAAGESWPVKEVKSALKEG
jgi:hypothetical protein